MRANPMETAPKDGRYIIVLAKGLTPVRVRWTDDGKWISFTSGTTWRDEEFIGWIKDIEPPEKRSLQIRDMYLKLLCNGYTKIEVGEYTRRGYSEAEMRELYEWLGQWYGKD